MRQSEPFLNELALALDLGLLAPQRNVLVGLSGGADSVALFTGLAFLADCDGRKYRITAAHLNHQLRHDAHEDEIFVRDFCEKLDIPCICESMQVAEAADDMGQGIEHAARELRYQFFKTSAVACGAEAVALAHHADDNAETILFRIIRGTGLRGLGGISPVRPLCSDPPIRIIRPLLGVSKDMIVSFLRKHHITWREDHTNLDTNYSRNYLRHELIPAVVSRLNGDFRNALCRLASQARLADEYIDRQSGNLLKIATILSETDRLLIDLDIFSQADEILQTTALRHATEILNIGQRDLTAEHIDDMKNLQPGQSVNLPQNFHAVVRRNMLVIEKIL
ncbi:MAG TPA: tRNA lysidine(34) synthetase TilS [Phycisphaerae bacterium]|nr:tRNA lysidine(34) synthetase TilS [Phycisphaerae bacterium]HPS53052.1 tRNA lysidine(34) synthetase TilS [Phycisphaerae bacterium]